MSTFREFFCHRSHGLAMLDLRHISSIAVVGVPDAMSLPWGCNAQSSDLRFIEIGMADGNRIKVIGDYADLRNEIEAIQRN